MSSIILHVTSVQEHNKTVVYDNVFRKVLNADGHSTRVEDKVLTINIKPGWKSGTKITFPKEGDQHPGRVPADIVFVIKVRFLCAVLRISSADKRVKRSSTPGQSAFTVFFLTRILVWNYGSSFEECARECASNDSSVIHQVNWL